MAYEMKIRGTGHPGALIVVPALVTYYRGTQRIQGAAKIAGRESVNGWIVLILYLLLAPGMWFYLQSSLNEVWEQDAEATAGQAVPPAQADEMPPRLQSALQVFPLPPIASRWSIGSRGWSPRSGPAVGGAGA